MKVCPACRIDYGGGEVFCPVDATRLVTTSQMSANPLDPNDPLIVASTVIDCRGNWNKPKNNCQ